MTRLEQLLADGTLRREAATCSTQRELAERVGLTKDAYVNGVGRIRKAGRYFPSFDDLRNRRPDTAIAAPIPFDEEKTDERAVDPVRFPSVAAFESGMGFNILGNLDDYTPDPEAKPNPTVPVTPIPDGHRLRGVSTLVRPDGSIIGQWVKTVAGQIDDSRRDWLEAIRQVFNGPLPKIDPVPWTEPNDADLLSVYPVGDPHVGLKAWREDAGANFDLKIAERNLVAAFERLIFLAPPSHEALIVFIGDNTHSDGQNNTTTKGTRVDVDDRTIKMMRTIISVARRAIGLALAKHARLTMIVERGNHDELLAAMLALALSLLYEDEPRVTIDVSPEMYHWYRFGDNLIGTHHGDKAKPMDLLGVMAVDRKEDWGATAHRRFYCGHYHHLITKEVPGLVIDYLPTLAGSDAWHRAMGYRSNRAMYMDVYDRTDGHVDRHIVGIGAVVRQANANAA